MSSFLTLSSKYISELILQPYIKIPWMQAPKFIWVGVKNYDFI